MTRLHALAFALAVMALAGCAGAPAPDAPPVMPRVDLDRYLGSWYEIAKIPNRFQRACVADTTARYARRPDGNIDVVNRCITRDGKLDEARGVARVVDSRTHAKLEVSFVSLFGWRLFWGDYWILDLGRDYDYAIVGHPQRRYGWILARTPILPTATRAAIDARLRALGYDPAQFDVTTQNPPP